MVKHCDWRYACPVVYIFQLLLLFSRMRVHRALRGPHAPPLPCAPADALAGLPLYPSNDMSPCCEVAAGVIARALGSGFLSRAALSLALAPAAARSDRAAAKASLIMCRRLLSRVFGSRLLSEILALGDGFGAGQRLPSDAIALQVAPSAASAYIRARGGVSWWAAVMACDVYAAAAHIDLGIDVNCAECGSDWTVLHWAAARGHVGMIELAVSCGARVDAGDRGGCTALHIAARNDHVHAVTLLVNCGADVGARGDGNFTPLHMAAYRGHASVAGALVALRADLRSQCDQLRTPLHWAAHEGQCDVIRLLLSSAADVNAAAGDGASPLHLAAFKGQCAAMLLLLEGGADVNARQSTGPHSRDR
jgi:hypothetical protein